jgi:hypothetical protein
LTESLQEKMVRLEEANKRLEEQVRSLSGQLQYLQTSVGMLVTSQNAHTAMLEGHRHHLQTVNERIEEFLPIKYLPPPSPLTPSRKSDLDAHLPPEWNEHIPQTPKTDSGPTIDTTLLMQQATSSPVFTNRHHHTSEPEYQEAGPSTPF